MCAEISCLSFGVPIGYSSPLTLTDQVNRSLCVSLSVCWLVWVERCAYICLFCLCVGWSDCQSLHEWRGVLTFVCFLYVLVGLTVSPYMGGEVCLHLSVLSVCWLVWLCPYMSGEVCLHLSFLSVCWLVCIICPSLTWCQFIFLNPHVSCIGKNVISCSNLSDIRNRMHCHVCDCCGNCLNIRMYSVCVTSSNNSDIRM